MAPLLMLLQATAPAVSPPPARFSILAPNCPQREDGEEDIVVCGRGLDSPLLPLPAERGPRDRPVPGNSAMDPAYALDGGDSCAAHQGGCQVGVNVFGPPVMLVRVAAKLINPSNDCCSGDEATDPIALVRDGVRAVKRMARRKPDTSNRVPIPLQDDPLPALRP